RAGAGGGGRRDTEKIGRSRVADNCLSSSAHSGFPDGNSVRALPLRGVAFSRSCAKGTPTGGCAVLLVTPSLVAAALWSSDCAVKRAVLAVSLSGDARTSGGISAMAPSSATPVRNEKARLLFISLPATVRH